MTLLNTFTALSQQHELKVKPEQIQSALAIAENLYQSYSLDRLDEPRSLSRKETGGPIKISAYDQGRIYFVMGKEKLIARGGSKKVSLGLSYPDLKELAVLTETISNSPSKYSKTMHENAMIRVLSDIDGVAPLQASKVYWGSQRGQKCLKSEMVLPLAIGSMNHGDIQDLDFEKRLAILYQVTMCLKEIHQKGIAHRDISPGNILCYQDGEKVVGKLWDFESCTFGEDLDKLVGNPQTISPEFIRSMIKNQKGFDHLDHAKQGDIYSLGVVFCLVLTGQNFVLSAICQSIKNTLLQILSHHQRFAVSQRLGKLESEDYASYQAFQQYADNIEEQFTTLIEANLSLAEQEIEQSIPDPDLQDLVKRMTSMTPNQRPPIEEICAALSFIVDRLS